MQIRKGLDKGIMLGTLKRIKGNGASGLFCICNEKPTPSKKTRKNGNKQIKQAVDGAKKKDANEGPKDETNVGSFFNFYVFEDYKYVVGQVQECFVNAV